MSEVRERLQEVFRDVFDDDDLVLADEMNADSIERWDSLEHVNLIIATEREFAIRFATREISLLKEADQNVGSFIRMIESKLGSNGG
ncbi:MAG: acyl carrier protein [Myxococcota bacterium]